MRYREPFKVFKKKLNSRKSIYYYTVYDEFNKRKQFSTGCKTKHLALKYCYELFKNDSLIQPKNILFSKYTENWYVYDKCSYIKTRLESGKKYSRTVAVQKRSQLVNKIIPFFGELYINNINAKHIEKWINELKKLGLSNSTINVHLSTLSVIFNEAFRCKIILENPFTYIKLLVSDSKEKTILEKHEVSDILDETRVNSIWNNYIYYLITLIASQTGMRIGEIQALLKENLHDDYIYVKHTWDKYYGLKCTKNGHNRIVPISKELFTKISDYGKLHNFDFIFANKQNKPVTLRAIHQGFYKALSNIGLSEDERKKRNITFHSWRHYYNTQLIKKGVPVPIIQAIIGHSDKGKMTEHYTKLSKEDLSVVLD